MTLYEEHIKDLHASGLSDKTISAMEVYSLDSRNLVGMKDAMVFRVKSALVFPYFNHGIKNNFIRAKLFPPYKGKDGIQKYWQPSGSETHLYILPAVNLVIKDPTQPLLIVEGEKKTAKAIELGFMAVGLGGLWNWKEKNVLRAIEEFNSIAWASREVIIIPDSDSWIKKDLRMSMYALFKELEGRGASIKFKVLERITDGEDRP